MRVVAAGAVADSPFARMVWRHGRVAAAAGLRCRFAHGVWTVAASALSMPLVARSTQNVEMFVARAAGCGVLALGVVRFVTADALGVTTIEQRRSWNDGFLFRVTGLAVAARCCRFGVLLLVAGRAGLDDVGSRSGVRGAHLFMTLVARGRFGLCILVGSVARDAAFVTMNGHGWDRPLLGSVATDALVRSVFEAGTGMSLGSFYEAVACRAVRTGVRAKARGVCAVVLQLGFLRVALGATVDADSTHVVARDVVTVVTLDLPGDEMLLVTANVLRRVPACGDVHTQSGLLQGVLGRFAGTGEQRGDGERPEQEPCLCESSSQAGADDSCSWATCSGAA